MEVLWYTTTSAISRGIRLFTKSPFSHVALWIDDQLWESTARGVVCRVGEEALNRKNLSKVSVTIEVNDTDKEQILEWLKHREGSSYSFLGFLSLGLAIITGFDLILTPAGQYVCSTLVATVLQYAGYIPMVDARNQTPASLFILLGSEALSGTI